MRIYKTFAWVLLVFASFFSTQVNGQYDFFYSFKAPEAGVQNSDASICVMPSYSGSLYLYYTTVNSDLNVAAFLDITTSRNGVIEFTSAETFEFDITMAGIQVGHRWTEDGISGNSGAFGVGNLSHDGQCVQLAAFTVSSVTGVGGSGLLSMNQGPDFVDAGYDPVAEAFLFARLDFDVIGVGEVRIVTSPGTGGVIHDGQSLDPSFGAAIVFSVPLSGCPLGDVDQNGFVDLLDVNPFVELLVEGAYQFEADVNSDGNVDLLDVASFVELLTGV